MSFADWAALSDAVRVCLVELDALKVADNSTLKLYLASHAYAAAAKYYVPCVNSLPRLTRQSNDTLDPNHIPSWGELELHIEPDYRPDPERTVAWNDLFSPAWSFLGQPISIKIGGTEFAEAEFVTVFEGFVNGVTWADNRATLTVYDRSQDFSKKAPDFELPENSAVVEESWGESVPLVLGKVKNYRPALINTGATYKFALACHVIEDVETVYTNGFIRSVGWSWTQKDVSPAHKNAEGAATILTFGPYTGAAVRREWLLQIDSLTTPNDQGVSGPEVGLATFKISNDGGLTWPVTGARTWRLIAGTVTKNPAAGVGAMNLGGAYTGDTKRQYQVKITREGVMGGSPAPQFQYSEDNGATWSAGIDIADTDPIPLSRGLTAAFAGAAGHLGGVTKTPGTPLDPSPGTLSAAGSFTGNATTAYQAIITRAGNVGEAPYPQFKWTDNGGSTWHENIDIEDTDPIALSNGVSIAFTDPTSDPPRDDYDLDDQWDFTAYPPFLVNDLWSWTFVETTIPLGDGVAVQFYTQAGQDFYLGDEFRFILMSTLSVNETSETPEITVDAQGLISPVTGAYTELAGEIIRALIVLFAGWDGAADFDTAALAAFNAAIPYQVGLVVDSPTELSQIIDDLLTGIPALYTIRLDGKFYLAELTAPAGAAAWELVDPEIMESPQGEHQAETIFRRVYVQYDRNWNTNQQVQDVTPERLQWIRREWRQVSRRDETILQTYPLAKDLGPLETALMQRSDAEALAGKLLALYRTRHEQVAVTTRCRPYLLELNDQGKVSRTKFGLNNGELFKTLGIDLDMLVGEAALTLWR